MDGTRTITEGKHFIDGRWSAGDGPQFSSQDPSSNTDLWIGRAATDLETIAAVASARRGFDVWRRLSSSERQQILEKFADLLAGERGDELAQAISAEVGKPLWESRTEVAAVRGKVAASIEGAERNSDAIRDAGGAISITRFVPVGPIAVIGPFNFPAHMSNGHIVPALLAGNSVILKPSPLAPRCAEIHVEALLEAGVPHGVISLLHGGAEVVNSLINHGVDGLCFTGSRRAGTAIHQRLAGHPEIMLALEMGGNSPLIVWSYDRIDAAVLVSIQSAFITAGQRCNCARRLIVNSALAEPFLARLGDVTRNLQIGSPAEQPDAFMGPLITKDALRQFLDAQDSLIERGGKSILLAAQRGEAGNFVSPGLIDMSEAGGAVDEEIFGPLLQVDKADTLQDAVIRANATRYGLSAGLISRSRQDFDIFRENVRAGLLNWNQQLTGASGLAPFGGLKYSGNHRPAGILSSDYVVDGIALTEVPALELPKSLPPGVKL